MQNPEYLVVYLPFKASIFHDFVKLNLYALFDPIAIQAVVETLSLIENNTGLKVNYDKTSLCRIGSLANTDAKICTTKNFSWTNHDIEVLGVTLSNDITQVTVEVQLPKPKLYLQHGNTLD